MVNFKIIENAPPRWHEKYYEFVELYNNPEITKTELLKILDWNLNQFNPAREQAIKERLIPELRKPLKAKHYYKTSNGQYMVQRDTKTIFVRAYCHSEEEAQLLVEYLHENGWTMENVDKWRKKEWM